MKLRAWMEMYLHRGRHKKSKKDKKKAEKTNIVEPPPNDNDDKTNANNIYESIDNVVIVSSPVLKKDVIKYDAGRCDARRTPLLGIRSAAYSRANSVNEFQEPGSSINDVTNLPSGICSSVSSMQSLASPAIRSKIKTNPWFRSFQRYESGKNKAGTTSEEDEDEAISESSSNYAADDSTAPSSNASTLDSAYRTPITKRKEPVEPQIQIGTLTKDESLIFQTTDDDSLMRDSGYVSQDSKYRSLGKTVGSARSGNETDDSGTLMTEKDWSSSEVDCTEPTLKQVDVEEAYSKDFSLPVKSSKMSSDEGPRTIREICGGLEEKVRKLRLERLLVEEKIKEAKEEERLRCEHRIRFQKEMIVHRRQLLLRTLQNIRLKLENQSHRLQDAYSTTLGMQMKVRQDPNFSNTSSSIARKFQ